MPVLNSNFKHASLLFHYHLQTIYPALIRRVNGVSYEPERIETPDKDFLDLYWTKTGSKKLVVLSHGLEGNAHRMYIVGMAKIFSENGWDALAWNYRGCSDEMNRNLIMYHSGATYDLDTVLQHAGKEYDEIVLIGFSLGGNLTLKYLGENPDHPKIVGSVTFSVPMDLHNSCLGMNEPRNRLYTRRFLKLLSEKVHKKAEMFPSEVDPGKLNEIRNIYEFDDHYTAPIHGFGTAANYYKTCSAIHFIPDIDVPTLIVNARNDSFLSESCYPTDSSNPNVFFEFPETGGHVGFTPPGFGFPYWSEKRALEFILSLGTKP